ncbi:MAG: DUF3822 family protein [Bacteroidota bacterium]
MNDKNSILLIDPEFYPVTAGSCSLVIKVGADSYSYAIIDESGNTLLALFDHQECEKPLNELLKTLETDANLTLNFTAVKASVYTTNTISVPNELYNSGDISNYGKYFPVEQSDKIYSSESEAFGITSVFNFDEQIQLELINSFPNCVFLDQNSPCLSLLQNQESDTLLLDFTVGTVNCTYVSSGSLVFQNYYEIANEEEFNYYLLLMIKQLSPKLRFSQVLLSGIVHEDDNRFQIVKKYFSEISFTKIDSETLDLSILDDMPKHYYTTTLAILACE